MGVVSRQELGKTGEEAAAACLKKQGYRILERNFKCRLGEIDIIAREGRVLCFIEVKTRAGESFGPAEEALHRAKQRKISQAVLCYLKMRRLRGIECRFDVVCVNADGQARINRIHVIRDAFPLDEAYFF